MLVFAEFKGKKKVKKRCNKVIKLVYAVTVNAVKISFKMVKNSFNVKTDSEKLNV